MIEDIEGLILIIAVILLVLNVAMFIMMGMQLSYGSAETIDSYTECILKLHSRELCNAMFPPLPLGRI